LPSSYPSAAASDPQPGALKRKKKAKTPVQD
jgi:hypothetical protein